MNDRDFKAEIKKGLEGGYLFYGEEEFMKHYYIGEAKKAVIGENTDFADLNISVISADDFALDKLYDAMQIFPMMSDKAGVFCEVRLSSLKEKEKEELLGLVKRLNDYPMCVLFIIAPDGYFDAGNPAKNKPSPFYKKLTEHLKPVEFAKQTPAALRKWCERKLNNEGVSANENALNLLCKRCDYNMVTLACECDKLACLVKSRGGDCLTEDDVSEYVAAVESLDTFALTNAVLSGDRKTALHVLREYKDKRESPIMISSGIIADFRNMLVIASYMKNGKNKAEIAKEIKMHEFRVGKYIQAIGDTDIKKIRASLERCRETDALLKSSRLEFEALERLICTIPSKKRF